MYNFQLLNNASYFEEDGVIRVSAFAKTDFFVNPETSEVTANGQFVYCAVKGDFVMQAKVSCEFKDTYDACVLLAYDHKHKWAKACFERTDFGSKAVVTVMTNGVSDDANGINTEQDQVWLRLSRKNDMFAVHYSLDGETFIMARLCRIPMSEEIKVGIAAQSPTGDGGERFFENFSLENRSLTDIRLGK